MKLKYKLKFVRNRFCNNNNKETVLNYLKMEFAANFFNFKTKKAYNTIQIGIYNWEKMFGEVLCS